MPIDVIDLRSFYGSSLGDVARRVVHKIVRQRFSELHRLFDPRCRLCDALSRSFPRGSRAGDRLHAGRARRGELAVSGLSSSALVETTAMPLPNSCIDRALIIHALEITEHPRDLLAEIWRILTPGGRVVVVVPGRSGLWARLDRTPFGHGRPYSRGQLAELLREMSVFPDSLVGSALLSAIPAPDVAACGKLCRRDRRHLSLPCGGVLIVEATKLLYRPITVRNPLAYAVPNHQPALVPEPAGVSPRLRACPEGWRMRRQSSFRTSPHCRAPALGVLLQTEAFGQEQAAMHKAFAVDPMTETGRKMPLTRNSGPAPVALPKGKALPPGITSSSLPWIRRMGGIFRTSLDVTA